MAEACKTVLVTRPNGAGKGFVKALRAATSEPFRAILSPVLEIGFLSDWTVPPQDVDIIFTSQNGVAAYATKARGESRRAWCVGSRTALAAEALGFATYSADGDADALVALILQDETHSTFAHIRGVETRGDILARLQASGLDVIDCIAYRQTPVALSQEAQKLASSNQSYLLPVFSPKTARTLVTQLSGADHAWVVCLSEAVAEPFRTAGFKHIICAKEPTQAEMVKTVVDCLGGNSARPGP